MSHSISRTSRLRLIAAMLGMALTVAAVYVLTCPGRIDLIDGQVRYEVTWNLISRGRAEILDPYVMFVGVRAPSGRVYSSYGPGTPILSVPFVWAGSLGGEDHAHVRRHFFFSLVQPVMGALLAALMVLFYVRLGLTVRRAVFWGLVGAFAMLVWPVSLSSFDQTSHALFVVGSAYLAYQSGAHGSVWRAAAAGLLGGLLFCFQEPYVLMVPGLALTMFAVARTGWRSRLVAFAVGSTVGPALWAVFNFLRFGSPLQTGRFSGSIPILGSPLVGFVSLLVSPGKGILFFSPPIVLAVLGMRWMVRERRWLAAGLLLTVVPHFLFLCSLSFFGSDWCWGPRYLVPASALLCLAMPWHGLEGRWRRLVPVLILSGVVVQSMALSLDHQRFFNGNRFLDYFYVYDPLVYFHHSQLFERPGELIEVAREGVPPSACVFSPTPYPEAVGWCPIGCLERRLAPLWMRQYKVFWLPRPWPLWMPRVAEASRYVPIRGTMTVCLLMLAVGVAVLVLAARRPPPVPDGGALA